MIKEQRFSIFVKPNSKKNEIIGYDASRKAYVIRIAARPEDNKANLEAIKFLSKTLGKKARIVSGLTSKTKVISTE
ncbi:MAG TPA: DUF167 domain-containing protein [Candidatus Nanoarchaeia archaeon]|nr:DUF167 domain-containing protein [Candidatus Nanoarchaeia archaeon]